MIIIEISLNLLINLNIYIYLFHFIHYSDELCNFAIQKGAEISRSNVRFFKHNDMNDLEEVLESIHMHDKVNNSLKMIIINKLF